jgi:hypothetical protein
MLAPLIYVKPWLDVITNIGYLDWVLLLLIAKNWFLESTDLTGFGSLVSLGVLPKNLSGL